MERKIYRFDPVQYSYFNEKGDIKSDKSRTRYAKKRTSSKTKSVRRKMARNSRRKNRK